MAREALSSNLFDLNRHQSERQVSKPHKARSLRYAYGAVTAIDDDTFQVKVRLEDGTMVGMDPEIGDWLPLMTPLDDVLLRWGQLRKGLKARVFFYGEARPQDAMAEIVGDEYTTYVKQEPRSEGGVGVHKLLSPKFP